jgi:homogentisate phytyltransferase/homogentisate geranylgeranyltransferase
MRAAPVGGGAGAAAAAAEAAAAKATEEEQQQPLSHSSNGNGHTASSSLGLGAAISAAAAGGADAAASESRRRLAEAAAAATNATPQHQQGIRNPAHALDVLYRFSRPHTMIGTFLSVMSVSAMALPPTMLFPPPAAATSAVAVALAAALCANVAIVGLNQLYDVEIDRVNKPYLPLASGELTIAQGWGIVSATAVASLVLAVAAASPPLLATVAGSLLLGLVYSTELPFMRWKRSPVLAAACILAVRAIAVQLGFFLHAKRAMVAGGVATTAAATATAATTATTIAPLAFAVSFMALFSVVIALFKDLPDVRGDRANGIATFSVRFGTPRVFGCCVAILAAAYAGGVVYGLDMARRAFLAASSAAAGDSTSSVALMALPGSLVAAGHALLGGWLVARSKKVDTSSPASLTAHYMWVWKLFYAEYLLLPLLR